MNSELRDLVFKKARETIEEYGMVNLSRWELCEDVGISPGSFAHVMGYGFDKFLKVLCKMDISEPTFGVEVEKTRTNPALRKENILQVAMVLATRKGYRDFKCIDLADAAGVSPPLIIHYFGNMKALRRAIMRRAVEQKVLTIVAEGLSHGDLIARKAPRELKAAALAELYVREV